MSDLIQIIACLYVLIGIYLYGWKHPTGPLFSCMGSLICIGISVTAHLPWMALLNVILAGMHFINLMKWSKNRES